MSICVKTVDFSTPSDCHQHRKQGSRWTAYASKGRTRIQTNHKNETRFPTLIQSTLREPYALQASVWSQTDSCLTPNVLEGIFSNEKAEK